MSVSTADRALKHILKRDKATREVLGRLAESTGVECAFESMDGQVLWGREGTYEFSRDLVHEGMGLGRLRYDSEKALLVFDTLRLLFQKEWEKKKIGKEVLGLYREINMIYDLSELISEKIDAESIAKVFVRGYLNGGGDAGAIKKAGNSKYTRIFSVFTMPSIMLAMSNVCKKTKNRGETE